MASTDRTTADLLAEIIRLGPWHYDIEVTPEISTRAFLDAPTCTYPDSFGVVSFLRHHHESLLDMYRQVYPRGLAGKSVLDCSCNCGPYLFYAKELGAGRCFGSDVRPFWIEQARWLAAHRTQQDTDLTFEVLDLYDLPKRGLEPFDISIFGGIFYHLPDPMTGLKAVADLTTELLIINTATRNGYPDGMLHVSEESRDGLLSGVYGLNWFPTGPKVIARICAWLGFPETRLHWHITTGEGQPLEMGRLQMFAARRPETFAHFDRAHPAPQ